MRITSKGQVTIPAHEQVGLLPHTEVAFEFDGRDVRIVHFKQQDPRSQNRRMIGRLRGSATSRMSIDEIMALTRQ